ncbi:retron St85 family RNA-directed DNA polymerase [bacterium]|nr:retron St85 family RNA-directed DNA polymerase [bacterium]
MDESILQNGLKLPLMYVFSDLANNVRLSPLLLYTMLKHSRKFYKKYEKPKKHNNGVRIIYQPNKEMKAVQGWILREILDKVDILLEDNITGFRRGMNTLDNAKMHEENRSILCMDIKNYFPSINYDKVRYLFSQLGYNDGMSSILAKLCTVENILPQGGITSPAISNYVCRNLDAKIRRLISDHDIVYSRYADDLAFSSSSSRILCRIIPNITIILQYYGFQVNRRKTRIMGPSRRRKITGLTLSDQGIGIGHIKKKEIRKMIFSLSQILTLKDEHHSEEQIKMENYLKGYLSYINCVDKKNYNYFQNYIGQIFQNRKCDLSYLLIGRR